MVPEDKKRCYMVRTSEDLAEKGIVGVGWRDHIFEEHKDAESAISSIDQHYGIGRSGNQIRRFFNIKDNDYIVVPLPYKIAIGLAKGNIFSDKKYSSSDQVNQRHVIFPRKQDGSIVRFSRYRFSEAFQRRLRVRGMIINDLSEFRKEIIEAYDSIENGTEFSWKNAMKDKVSNKYEDFKKSLLKNIQDGKTNLKAGGVGLENLVKELLEIDGYQAEVLSKKEFKGFADADVKASKTDRCVNIDLLVQIKHHYDYSNDYGINQLIEIKNDANSKYAAHDMVFLTSAFLPDKILEEAAIKDITVIDGNGLVDWISDNIEKLSESTKLELGIYNMPVLISN